MPRDLSEVVKSALAGNYIRTAHLFRAVFTNSSTGQDETYHFTDNFRSVEFNGETYLALGHLLGISGLEESSDFKIATASVSLSAVDLAMISSILQYRYIDRTLEIWRCFFSVPAEVISIWDDAGVWNESLTWSDYGDAVPSDLLLDAPVKIFSGGMSAPSIAENPDDGKCVVTLTASSHFADFSRRPGRHTNHQEQQAYFPGDQFFKGWGNPDQELVWGKV